jgi:hypothetical protein
MPRRHRGVCVWPATQLGSEFMPSLNEGTLMYMPTPILCKAKRVMLLTVEGNIVPGPAAKDALGHLKAHGIGEPVYPD